MLKAESRRGAVLQRNVPVGIVLESHISFVCACTTHNLGLLVHLVVSSVFVLFVMDPRVCASEF
jgi:hypothetical protein